MTSISPEQSRIAPEQRPYVSQLLVREMWASLAIIVMWLSVLLDAVFGPDIVTHSGVGDIGEHTRLFRQPLSWRCSRFSPRGSSRRVCASGLKGEGG